MSDNIEFEILAKLHGLGTDKTNDEYHDLRTDCAKVFWDAQQVKIDKLEHDKASTDCACRMFQYLLDKHEEEKSAVTYSHDSYHPLFPYFFIGLACAVAAAYVLWGMVA
ncbi:MAG: hypothetical protein WC657_07530 [Candidatus Paceibacterota bacterium]|jgi:hypothetical protein